MATSGPARVDFFLSYTQADRSWAEWIAWVLEEARFTTKIQAWDFRPGSNFVVEMQRASAGAERTIPVLSPDYLQSGFAMAEWAAAFAQDPTGEKGKVLPVLERRTELDGLLSSIVYIDLVDLDEAAARERLLAGLARGRAKPASKPVFPGGPRPRFPGEPLRLVLHRLVAVFARRRHEDDEARDAVEGALFAEANRLNRAGYPAPLLAWQSHLRAAAESAWEQESTRAARLCSEFGYHLWRIGDLVGARQYWDRALVTCEKVLGPEHPETAQSLNNLGFLLRAQGDLKGALPYYERALAILEKRLGPNHPNTKIARGNLESLRAPD